MLWLSALNSSAGDGPQDQEAELRMLLQDRKRIKPSVKLSVSPKLLLVLCDHVSRGTEQPFYLVMKKGRYAHGLEFAGKRTSLVSIAYWEVQRFNLFMK